MTAARYASVDDYFASLDDPTKADTLRSVIDTILKQFPELEAKIAWNVPQIHRRGEYVFGVGAFKNHLTLAPWSAQVLEDFAARLAKFVVNKHTFQIPIDWKIDKKLLQDLVRARLAELG